MTLQEFKSWLEGFSENIEGAPSTKQWERIQEQIQKVRAYPAVNPSPIEYLVPNSTELLVYQSGNKDVGTVKV